MLKKILPYVFGLAVLGIILYQLDTQKIVELALSMNMLVLASAVLLLVPMFFLKSLRWNILLRSQKIKYSTWDTFVVYLASLSFGLVTPARIGELVKLAYLRRDKHPMGKSLYTIMIDRVFDTAFLLLFSYIGLFVFASLVEKTLPFFVTILVVSVIMVLFAIFFKEVILRTIKRVMERLLPNHHSTKAINEVFEAFNTLNFPLIGKLAFITFLSYIVHFFQAFIIAHALGLEANFFLIAFALSIAALATLIPITVAGIGTRDVAFLTVFTAAGFAPELSIAFSTVMLVLTLALAGLAFFFYLTRPVPLHNITE